MLSVGELFRGLSFGELQAFSMGNEGAGFINPTQFNKLIHHTNEALLRLFTRFELKRSKLFLEEYDHITQYPLRADFATSAASQRIYRYIRDHFHDPFCGDVVKVLQVTNKETGEILPLDDRGNPRSVFMVEPDVLHIPRPKLGKVLMLEYQARHHWLREACSEPEEGETEIDYTGFMAQRINIPEYLEGALKAHIAFQVLAGMKGAENTQASHEALARYDSICDNADVRGQITGPVQDTKTTFEERGFV